MATETLTVPRESARRFLVRSFGLDGFQGLPDVTTALDRLELIQEDSINVCGRIHDLLLWSRVRDYAPADLHGVLYGESRAAFEYVFGTLNVFPLRDYPYVVRSMRARAATPGRHRGLLPEEEPVAERLLRALDENGPLASRESHHADDGYAVSGWGTKTRVAALVLDKLWLHGRVAIAKRENFQRWFDRTERLLPDAAPFHAGDAALPDEHEETRYRARKALRTARLFRPHARYVEALGKSAFVPVQFEDAPLKRPYYVLAEDADALRQAGTLPVSDDVKLLAPLEPLVYDRARTKALFDFEYTWEVYVPEAKRRWGYYVLPILWGDRLVGRVDPKIDRKTKTLTLHSLTLEPGVDADALAPKLAARLHDFARFLGAERIDLPGVEPDSLRAALKKHGL